MSDVASIIDRIEKRRTVKNVTKIDHPLEGDNGEMTSTPCVEFTIIGNTREWRDWMTLADFERLNPDFDL